MGPPVSSMQCMFAVAFGLLEIAGVVVKATNFSKSILFKDKIGVAWNKFIFVSHVQIWLKKL